MFAKRNEIKFKGAGNRAKLFDFHAKVSGEFFGRIKIILKEFSVKEKEHW